MNVATQMLEARPEARGMDHAALALAIDSLADVTTAATTCADACLLMADVDERRDCIQACLDAADIAGSMMRILSRSGPTIWGTRALVDGTARLLAECETHCATMGETDKHARICAETCARAEQALAGLQRKVAEAESAD